MNVTYENSLDFWKNRSKNNEAEIDQLLGNFRILFAFNSNKIENADITYHDTREIFENGKIIGYTGDTRTIFEIENQKRCYEMLLPKIAAKEPLSIELIKETHHILTYGTYDERRYSIGERAGEFKKHDYVTGKNEVGTPPEFVEEDLRELLNEIKDVSSAPNYNALTVAAYFHASFEFIHPFADGNGRVGRTLMNYYLMINDNPPIIIYDEDKNVYYSALEKYDTNEELTPLTDFLKEQTIKTWSNSVIRNNELSKQQSCSPNNSNYRIKKNVLVDYLGNEEQPVIPESVKSIGDRAFMGNTSIKHIEIPDSVERIGNQAFEGCINLKSASIPKTCDCDITAFPRSCSVHRKDYGGLKNTLKYD